MTPPNETPAHQMHARRMHAREVQINHQHLHGWSICRDPSCKIRVFALRAKRSLWASAAAAGELHPPKKLFLEARGPTERDDEASQKNTLHATAGCYLLEVSAALSRQLPNCESPLSDDQG
jgi:hypothetical protein